MPKYIKKYGVRSAVEVAQFEASQVHAVKALVEKEKIDCDFVLTRACDATLHKGLADETEKAFEEMLKAGVTDFKDVYHARKGDAERVRLASSPFPALVEWRPRGPVNQRVMAVTDPMIFYRSRVSKVPCRHLHSQQATSGHTRW